MKAAFKRLDGNVRQAGDLATETARLWLDLSPEQRDRTGVVAPTRALRDGINATIREGLVAEGAVSGPAMEVGRLVPRDLTRAEMTRSSSYGVGDTVIFVRQYKMLGVERGDERRVAAVDMRWGVVRLDDAKGNLARWRPERLAAAKGGIEVFRSAADAASPAASASKPQTIVTRSASCSQSGRRRQMPAADTQRPARPPTPRDRADSASIALSAGKAAPRRGSVSSGPIRKPPADRRVPCARPRKRRPSAIRRVPTSSAPVTRPRMSRHGNTALPRASAPSNPVPWSPSTRQASRPRSPTSQARTRGQLRAHGTGGTNAVGRDPARTVASALGVGTGVSPASHRIAAAGLHPRARTGRSMAAPPPRHRR